MMRFLLLLLQQRIVQILQKRHPLRRRIVKVILIDLMHTSVDDSLLYRLQAFLSADNQLTQGQDEIRLQGNRVILLRVVRIDVHGIDVLRAGRTDLDDLPFKPLYQSCIFCLRIADDDIVIRHQEGIGHFTLGTEGFT